LGVGVWGLGVGGGGLWFGPTPPNPQSPIPNPQKKLICIKDFNNIKFEYIIINK